MGPGIRARLFDVFGNAIDRQAAPTDVQWRTIHRAPPPLARRSTKSEIFETGINVIDVLVPLEQMTQAEQAIHQAVANIPTAVSMRLESADTLSDLHLSACIEITRSAQARFKPR